jgi:ABC-type glycerol-3-phosphate transport system substrate-binding protein
MGAGLLLAACGRWLRPGAQEVVPTQEPQEINFLVRPDLRLAFAIDVAVEAWNAEFAQKIVLDELTGDAASVVSTALAAGEPAWDGFAMIEAPSVTASWVRRGLIQPLDDLILVSSIPGADQVIPAIIPAVLASSQYEGHQYIIPGNVSSIALGWYWEPLQAAGVEPPQTWDEVRAAAEQIKAAAPGWTPFDAMWSPLCDQIALIWSATSTPLTEDGLIDWTGEASLAALRWQQEMVAAELMPADHTRSLDNWLKGEIAIMNMVDALGPIAQQTFGVEAATTGPSIRREKDDPKAGAPFWLHGSVVLKDAANPQGIVDFYLWWVGPNNQATGKQVATVAAKPAYQYTYDEFIVNDPVQQWQVASMELVRDSVPFPANPYWQIQTTAVAPWIRKALDPRNYLSAEQAMQAALDEIHTAMDSLAG